MSRGFNLQDYVTVQDRIRQFWAEYPDGRIETDIMSDPGDFTSCRYIARVYKRLDDARATATGWAFEHVGERGPNQTSHEENCETSAIGRALANMGYATSQHDRPSREEMAKVQRGPASPAPANVDTATGESHETRNQRIDRIVRALSGTLTTSQYNLILREVEGHQLGDDEHIAALIYEAEQRREAARAKQSSGQQQLGKA